jgi:hypothetical protein
LSDIYSDTYVHIHGAASTWGFTLNVILRNPPEADSEESQGGELIYPYPETLRYAQGDTGLLPSGQDLAPGRGDLTGGS